MSERLTRVITDFPGVKLKRENIMPCELLDYDRAIENNVGFVQTRFYYKRFRGKRLDMRFTALVLTLLMTGFFSGPLARAQDPATWVNTNLESLVQLYIHFHKNPELSFQEEQTGIRFGEELTKIGCEVTNNVCLLYTSPSPRDCTRSRMPSSA